MVHLSRTMTAAVALAAAVVSSSALTFAQEPVQTQPAPPVATPTEADGDVVAPEAAEDDAEDVPPARVSILDSARLRITLSGMVGYGHDDAVASLGFEKQGRVGYVVIGLSGTISDRFSYLVEINPVDETGALPSCGEENFYYPNEPSTVGPNVSCHPDGRTRVDDYRSVALDFLHQQGPIRQAYLQFTHTIGMKFGRFILPIGFYPEEVGSFTAKDATHIQRINAEANFGLGLSYDVSWRSGAPLARFNLAGFLGEGNRIHDYDYFYFQGIDLDSNSALTGLVSATVYPTRTVEFRAAYKKGFTGSKVERLPNYFASKRHDNAVVLSASYRPIEHVRLFGEYARYTWGPTATSAELLGLDQEPIHKPGYYVGADLSYPVHDQVRLGMVVTREELSRDDSLIKLLAHEGRFNVVTGKMERSTTFRWYAEIADAVTVAVYRNDLSNPFPWVSGIQPVAGPQAYSGSGRGNNKWGFVVRFRVR